MAKRFYKIGEMVWLTEDKVKGKIVSLDTKNLQVVVTVKREGGGLVEQVVSFMKIDKVKTKYTTKKVRVKTASAIPYKDVSKKPDTVLFAKVSEDAIIPSKRLEDAGYDIYASIKLRETEEGIVKEMLLKKFESNLVPTGIAVSLLPKYYMNFKHERGSTGTRGMAILSGVVDSGYRGEVFINIVPLFKDILITSTVEEVEDLGNVILYPYTKAIAQATIEIVPELNIKEITYEQLKAIPSQRGEQKLGASGK